MAYTYNLSTTVRGGKRAIWDSAWDGSGAEDERRAGLTGTSTYHQCSMIFDTSALSGKTITGINLTFTVVSGTIPGHGTNNFPICYKADSSTTSWKRSSTSAVGYIKNQTSGGGSYGASNTSMTVNMGTTLPSYGYVAGPIKSPSGSYKSVILGSTATLAVTTNENQYSYTLAYNANGGSGAPASETKTNIQVNPSCSFTVSSTKPTKSNTSPGNFTVTYNAGGGSVSTSPANTTATRTTSYTFSSWNTNAAGTGTNYAPGSTYTFTSGNVGDILYAKYSESTTVSSVTLPTPTRAGYTFNGWYTASTGGAKAGNAGAAYLPFNNITLYAQWTPLKYRIDYNGNAGTGVSGVPEYQEQTHGVELTLRSGTPTRTSTNATSCTIYYDGNGATNPSQASASRTISYTFVKWNTEQNGTGTAYSPGGKYSANKAATLWAQWSSTTTTSSVTLPTPSRSGYNFTGWYTAKTDGTKVGNAGASYNPGNTATSVTLYAQWSAANAFLSSFTNPAYCDGTSNNFTASWTPVGNCRYKITLTCGNASAVSSAVTAANVSSVSVTIPTTWYSMDNGPLKNSESATATCTLTTYENNGTTQLGTHSLSFTVRVPASVKPTLGTLSKSSSSDNGIVASWGPSVFVQGYSKVTLTLSVSDLHGASGVSRVRFYGPGIDQTVSSTTSPASAVVTSAGTLTYYADCEDTRGRKSTTSTTVTFEAYAQPTVYGIAVARCDNDQPDYTVNNASGLYFKATPSYGFSSVAGNNQLMVHTIQYRVHPSGEWSTAVDCTSGSMSGPWSSLLTNAYDVMVTLSDKIQYAASPRQYTYFTTTLPTVQGIWYGKGNDRLGLGGVPSGPGLHVDWNAEFNGVLDVTQRRCYATLSSAGWYRVIKCQPPIAYYYSGIIIKFYISVYGSQSSAHEISLAVTRNDGARFYGEHSANFQEYVEAIRATSDGTNLFVDIKWNRAVERNVTIYFEAFPYIDWQSYITAQYLQYVGPAPSGETVLTEYTFAVNTITDISSSFALNTSGISGLTGKIRAIYDASSGLVHLNFSAYTASATFGTSTPIFTCSNSRYAPKATTYGNGMIRLYNGEWYPYEVSIGTTGNIFQSLTLDATRVYGQITYPV